MLGSLLFLAFVFARGCVDVVGVGSAELVADVVGRMPWLKESSINSTSPMVFACSTAFLICSFSSSVIVAVVLVVLRFVVVRVL